MSIPHPHSILSKVPGISPILLNDPRSTADVNASELIRVTFPALPTTKPNKLPNYPFRLFDCHRFLKESKGAPLAVQQFNVDDFQVLCADAVETPNLKLIREWKKDSGLRWAAVSYDASTTYPGPDDVQTAQPAPNKEVEVHIQRDVLRSLCETAIQHLGVGFLWLDKLCVFQNSPQEVSMWRMPGNMWRSFGLADGTIVLLNGLCRRPPALKGPDYSGSFEPSPDFASSLRVCLELAFSRSLKEIDVLVDFAFIPPLAADGSELSHASMPFLLDTHDQTYRHLDVRFRGQAHTISFEDFLHASAGMGGLLWPAEQLSGPNGAAGSQSRMIMTPITTFAQKPEPGQRDLDLPVVRDMELLSRSQQNAKALLSLLSSRPSVPLCSNRSDLNDYNLFGKWEVAIWQHVLSRRADSCGQFVFGLAWLLQDLCNSQRDPEWRNPRRDRGTDTSGIQLDELNHSLVNGLMNTMRGNVLGSELGEPKPYYPVVQTALAFIVAKFNEIMFKLKGPSPTPLVADLHRGGFWKIRMPPDWICSKDEYLAAVQGSSTAPRTGPDADFNPSPSQNSESAEQPEIAYLALTATKDPFPVLALSLIWPHRNPDFTTEVGRCPPQVPVKICPRISSEQNADTQLYKMQCLELLLHTDGRYWRPIRYTFETMPVGGSGAGGGSAEVSSAYYRSWQLTP